MIGGRGQVAAGIEGVVRRVVEREESLPRPRRPESLHPAFSTADVDMRSLDAIVLPTRLVMPSRQPKIPEGRGVGAKLVGYDCQRRETALLQQLSHELERGSLVALGLDEDIQDLPLPVDGAPQVHPLATHRDEHLVEMPLRVRPRPMVSKATSDLRTEPGHPAADCLIGDNDPALGQQLFDVSITQRKTGIQPYGVLNNCGREVTVTVADCGHRQILQAAP